MLRVFSPLYEACGLKISGPPALSDCNVMITGIDSHGDCAMDRDYH
jgi:hypothetical protein